LPPGSKAGSIRVAGLGTDVSVVENMILSAACQMLATVSCHER